VQAARAPGAREAAEADGDVELDGMEAEEEMMVNGSGGNYAV
jgi:hypothetical protein